MMQICNQKKRHDFITTDKSFRVVFNLFLTFPDI
jgi:hypothetical protein